MTRLEEKFKQERENIFKYADRLETRINDCEKKYFQQKNEIKADKQRIKDLMNER